MQMKSVEKYRIMGIDPGTNYMGYGVLEVEGRTVRSVVLGDIDLHKLPDPYAKLRYIFERDALDCPRDVALTCTGTAHLHGWKSFGTKPHGRKEQESLPAVPVL